QKFITNSKGTKLFTCRWLPLNSEPKGLIFLCHGYAIECSITLKRCAIRLAEAGYAVYGMDYQGHGKSSGLRCYIHNFDDLVTDCSDHFTAVCERQENKKKKRIIMGESMGGAVVLLLHRKRPDYWDMAVLVAPMCKIANDVKPHPFFTKLAPRLSRLIPTWKLPLPDVTDKAFRVQEIRDEVRSNPFCYKGWPPIQTGVELLKVSLDLEDRLDEVSLPFIVVHGGEDRVTDPSVSQLLYQSAVSFDKTFKLYPAMWHSLTIGELPHNMDIVFNDIINWLDERVVLPKLK
ncbi:caffeoylshikimate esterase, partial [Phtheirospermum japonicum]